jgi:hypothetical protein
LKAYLEGKALGISVYDTAPPKSGKATRPYVTVEENIALTMDPREDGGPGTGAEATGLELVQMDLWQTWRDDNDKRVESATLPDAITRAIDGTQLGQTGTGIPPKRVYGLLQQNRVRILDREARIVHHVYTLAVHRVV